MKTKKIKDLPGNQSLRGVKFYLPGTKNAVYYYSQWWHPNDKSGVWYKKTMESSDVFPLQLDKLEEALEFKLA